MYLEATYLVQIIAILAFFVLLGAAVYMIIMFYICDNHNCKAFNDAADVAPEETKEYTIALLDGLYSDGIWPLPYLGAAVLTGLSLWLIGQPITVRNFAIVFIISFIVIYFLFAYLGHHYINFISTYASNYIQNNCPNTTIGEEEII